MRNGEWVGKGSQGVLTPVHYLVLVCVSPRKRATPGERFYQVDATSKTCMGPPPMLRIADRPLHRHGNPNNPQFCILLTENIERHASSFMRNRKPESCIAAIHVEAGSFFIYYIFQSKQILRVVTGAASVRLGVEPYGTNKERINFVN